MDAWHCATVAVLSTVLVAELGGGYLAFRRTVREAFEPEVFPTPDPRQGARLLSVFTEYLQTPDEIPTWMRIWLKLDVTDRAQDGTLIRFYGWRFSRVTSDTGIFIRATVRIGAGAFMLVRFALGHSGL